MTRLLSVLLVLAGLGLVAPPAHAAVSATINASATTVRDGSTVTFTGRAVEARLGSVVRLQHRRLDGSWAVVASKKLVETRRYSFTTTPPRGYQRYRVVMPRQLGHPYAASPALTIQVTWRPGVILGTVSHQVVDWATGAVVTSTLGATKDLAGGTELRREVRRADGSWALHGRVRTTADQTWRDSFASSHGQRFRYLAPAAGARLATASTVFAVDGRWTPTISASALLDPLTEIATATGDATGLSQGSTLQLQFRSGDQWYAEGSRVAVGADGSFSHSFSANMVKTYRFYAPATGPRRAAASAPFQIGEPTPARVELNTTTAVAFPSESTRRALVVALEQGQTFTYHGPYWVTESITDPSGNVLPGFGSSFDAVTAVAPVTGDYTITLTTARDWEVQRASITLSTPVLVTTAIDAPPADLTSSLPSQVVDLRFEGTVGAVISEYSPADSSVALTLLGPTGSAVPRWGSLQRQGKVWRLPDTGLYTLRFTPRTGDAVARPDQEVLSASEGRMILDGAPAHVTLDRPGRVSVVSVEVPAGLDVRISDTGSASEELFGPDGQLISTYTGWPDIRPTAAGVYSLLVSDDSPAAQELGYYATTPAVLQAATGTATTYDIGPAPNRVALVQIPVTAGQLLSFEILNSAGAFCDTWETVESGGELLDWFIRGDRHPSVFQVAQSGDLVLRVTPCRGPGSIRITPTTAVTPTLTGSTVDAYGLTTDTHRATVEATQVGEVMLVEYDAGTLRGRLDLRATASTFPDDARFSLAWATPGSSASQAGSYPVSWDSLGTQAWDFTRQRYFFVYAGTTATGTLDLEFRFLHQ